MKKEILYDDNAVKELQQFSKKIQKRFESYIEVLEQEGRLEFPEARKVLRNIFEIRVTHEGVYRGFYTYMEHPYIIILHFFRKKTQKTPKKNLKIIGQRLKKYV